MTSNDLPVSVWEFCVSSVEYRPRWSWRRFEDGGHVFREKSEPFHSLSAALEDARKHGFSDAFSQYTIV
jgi:hypothetical protein